MPPSGVPDGRACGIRLALAEVKGINEAEVARIVAARPCSAYHSLTDFWHRAQVSRPIAERLVLAGGFDSLYGIGSDNAKALTVRRRSRITRRDLLLQVAELDRHARALDRPRSRPAGPRPGAAGCDTARHRRPGAPTRRPSATAPTRRPASRPTPSSGTRSPSKGSGRGPPPSPRPPRRRGR